MRRLLFVFGLSLVVLAGMLLFASVEPGGPVSAPAMGSARRAATEVVEVVRAPAIEFVGADEATVEPVVAAPEPDRVAAREVVPARGEPELALRVIHVRGGLPIAGVRLWARVVGERSAAGEAREGSRGRLGDSVVTDRDGRCWFVVTADRDLSVYGYGTGVSVAQRVRALERGETREVVVEFQVDTVHVRGRVLSALDDSPVVGALIQAELVDRGVPSSEPNARSRSDRNGAFEIEARVSSDVEVEAAGFLSTRFGAGPAGSDAEERDIYLEPGATLVVTVREADGRVADGFDVTAHELARLGYGDQGIASSARTDASGIGRLEGLPADVALYLEVRREDEVVGRETGGLTLAPGAVEQREITLGGGVPLTGRLVDQAGDPWTYGAVRLTPSLSPSWSASAKPGSRTVDADGAGRFAFDDVGPGRWWLEHVVVDSFHGPPVDVDWTSVPMEIVIPRDSSGEEVELVVYRGLYISGRVEFPDGTPGADASVVGRLERSGGTPRAGVLDSGPTIRGWATETGAFRAGPLVPGEYSFSAHADHSIGTWHERSVASPAVLATAGSDGVVLKLRTGAYLGANVVDERGEVTDASYRLTDASTGVASLGAVLNGELLSNALAPGTYALTVTTETGFAQRSPIVLIEGEVEDLGTLRLALGARLTLRAGPRRVSGVVRKEGVSIDTFDLKPGETTTLVVPPGPVVVEHSGRRSPQSIHTTGGEVSHLAVR